MRTDTETNGASGHANYRFEVGERVRITDADTTGTIRKLWRSTRHTGVAHQFQVAYYDPLKVQHVVWVTDAELEKLP